MALPTELLGTLFHRHEQSIGRRWLSSRSVDAAAAELDGLAVSSTGKVTFDGVLLSQTTFNDITRTLSFQSDSGDSYGILRFSDMFDEYAGIWKAPGEEERAVKSRVRPCEWDSSEYERLESAIESLASDTASADESSHLTLTTLLTTSSWYSYTDEDGKKVVVDAAEELASANFHNLLITYLPTDPEDNASWLSKLFGTAPVLSPAVKAIGEENEAWLRQQSIPYTANVLYNHLSGMQNSRPQEAAKRIDKKEVDKKIAAYAQDKEFSKIGEALYKLASIEKTPHLKAFMNDDRDWGAILTDWAESEAHLQSFETYSKQKGFTDQQLHYLTKDLITKITVLTSIEDSSALRLTATLATIVVNSQTHRAHWHNDMSPHLEKILNNLKEGKDIDERLQGQVEAFQAALALTSLPIVSSIFSLLLGSVESPIVRVADSKFIEGFKHNAAITGFLKGGGVQAVRFLKVIALAASTAYLTAEILLDLRSGKTELIPEALYTTAMLFATGLEGLVVVASLMGKAYVDKISTGSRVMWKYFHVDTKYNGIAKTILGDNIQTFLQTRVAFVMVLLAMVATTWSLVVAIQKDDMWDIVFQVFQLSTQVATIFGIVLTWMKYSAGGVLVSAVALISLVGALTYLLVRHLLHGGPAAIYEQFIDRVLVSEKLAKAA